MISSATHESEREQRLNEMLLAYLEAVRAGWAPERRKLLAAYPDLRAELEEFFAGRDELNRITGQAALPISCNCVERTSDAQAELGQLGDFRLLREIGRGGMGVVYEADQISLHRKVAIKVLPFASAIDPRQLQRFQNEALAAAHLQHKNIVPVYAVGSERGVHYYAMQLVEGQSLAALIRELRRLSRLPEAGAVTEAPHAADATVDIGPVERQVVSALSRERTNRRRDYFRWVADLGSQAALALEHAHQMGIVHRDIKPANLLLNAAGQLWITDFGLARFSSDAGLTHTGEMLGTLRYASPEQALAKPGLVDHRADVYSLGATLYELLTLTPIFEGQDRHELLRQIADTEPRLPRLLDPTIPVELETIVLKSLAKEPAERYATAQDLADDLEHWRNDRPIRARRPALFERTARWARRHRSLVVSALAVLLLALACLTATTLLTAQAYERERQRTSEAEDRFRLARRLADEMIQIADEEAVDGPGQQLLRRRLLEAAVAYYQELIDQRRANPAAQAELEGTQIRVKSLLADLAVVRAAQRHLLLSDRAVQDDLQLSANQRGGLTVVFDDILERGPLQPRDLPGFASEERSRQLLTEMRAHEAAIVALLQPGQLRRLEQIALQLRGIQALREPEIVATLNLTAEQREQVRTLANGSRPGRGGPGGFGGRGGRAGEPGHPGGPPGGRGKGGPPPHPAEGVTSPEMSRALDLLTPSQRERWSELTGKPFGSHGTR